MGYLLYSKVVIWQNNYVKHKKYWLNRSLFVPPLRSNRAQIVKGKAILMYQSWLWSLTCTSLFGIISEAINCTAASRQQCVNLFTFFYFLIYLFVRFSAAEERFLDSYINYQLSSNFAIRSPHKVVLIDVVSKSSTLNTLSAQINIQLLHFDTSSTLLSQWVKGLIPQLGIEPWSPECVLILHTSNWEITLAIKGTVN